LIGLRELVRNCCPPILLKWLKRVREKEVALFDGSYSSWSAAQARSNGYDSDEIFQRVLESSLKVKHGDAVFERDSFCFYQEQFRWPTLACLMAITAQSRGRLNVLDFGGSLGSFYFQHRKFLQKVSDLSWNIVEQSKFVCYGKNEFQDTRLRFYESIDQAVQENPINCLFLSSVLQYLEFPYDVLRELAETQAQYLLIDRMPFGVGDADRLTVQHVPESIYKGSYPAWVLSKSKFEREIENLGYRLIADFPCDEVVHGVEFKGAFFERIQS